MVEEQETSSGFDIVGLGARAADRRRRRRLGTLGAGAILLLLARGRGGVARKLLAVGGGLLLLRGATGKTLKRNVKSVRDAMGKRADRQERFGQGTRDVVDEASWESFPASDAPSFSPPRSAEAPRESESRGAPSSKRSAPG